MKTYSGFTEKTAKNLLLDAGAFFKNYDIASDTPDTAREKLLGATRGGGQFIAKPVIRPLEVDGVKGNAKGLQILVSWEISIEANMLELPAETLKIALVSADIDEASNPSYDIITARNDIELSDYIDNITWIGTQSGSNAPVIIQVFNALSTEGLTLKTVSKDEAVVLMKFIGHYEGDDLETPPFNIYYPKADMDTVRPTVTVEPDDLEDDVEIDANIVWTFSEVIRQSTVTPANFFVLSEGQIVDGELSISGNKKVVTFKPKEVLESGTEYTAIVTVGVKDLAGNSLETNVVVIFTTKSGV